MNCKKCKHFDWSCNACDHDSGGYCDADVAEIVMKFFPDAPCNYNGMDEFADCDWCSEHCGKATEEECWANAIKEGWYDMRRSD